MRSFLFVVLALLLALQNLNAGPLPFNLIQPQPAYADSFAPPLGSADQIVYAPRRTFADNGALIENTDYGVKNPDMKDPDTCFHLGWADLIHAGEDLYNPDREVDTAGALVTAVANGTVIEVSRANWPGSAIVIQHILPGGQLVYSVYIHLDNVRVGEGPVSKGDILGSVTYRSYEGKYPEYHYSENGRNKLIADSHLHFEMRYFADARNIYRPKYPDCERGDGIGRGYVPPESAPENFPTPGAGYTDPTDFINAHLSANSPTPTPTVTPTPTLAPSPLLNNLAAYWKLDEARGARLDQLGRSPLADTNGVGQAAGVNPGGQSARLAAASRQYLSTSSAELNFSQDTSFTWAGWLYFESLPGADSPVILSKKRGSGNDSDYRLLLLGSGENKLRFEINSGKSGVTASKPQLSSGKWYFVLAWYDAAGRIGIQINNGGKYTVATNGSRPGTSTQALYLGWQSSLPNAYLNGRLDEFGFWKRVLSESESSLLYNRGAGCAYPFTTCLP